MMQITLPHDIQRRLITALKAAGEREIGGILMGQHVGENAFEVNDITFQHSGGSFASFLRSLRDVLSSLKLFFRQTGRRYTEFNYLGEWHSHPSFALYPSSRDSETMQEIVSDPKVGANFAVLMIVKLSASEQLLGTVTLYLPSAQMLPATLVRGEAVR